MKSRLILTTDRKSASEGEYIEIRWACDGVACSMAWTSIFIHRKKA
ncbi:MAG: hypothetical protein J6J25_00685 [Bacteroidales bacterium]|nr:hypothetical protein [Bacteroidales bacterium]